MRPLPSELATPPVTKMCFGTGRPPLIESMNGRTPTAIRRDRRDGRTRREPARRVTGQRASSSAGAPTRGGLAAAALRPTMSPASMRAISSARCSRRSTHRRTSTSVPPSTTRFVTATWGVASRRDLREVGHDEHLVAGTHLGERERPPPSPRCRRCRRRPRRTRGSRTFRPRRRGRPSRAAGPAWSEPARRLTPPWSAGAAVSRGSPTAGTSRDSRSSPCTSTSTAAFAMARSASRAVDRLRQARRSVAGRRRPPRRPR